MSSKLPNYIYARCLGNKSKPVVKKPGKGVCGRGGGGCILSKASCEKITQQNKMKPRSSERA